MTGVLQRSRRRSTDTWPGRRTAPARDSARAASDCTTGYSAARGRYDAEPRGKATGEDAAWLGRVRSRIGAVVAGRWTYEAAGQWGDENPWGLPLFIVTTGPRRSRRAGPSRSSPGCEEAVEQAGEAAGDKDVHVMGGADVIRQALEAGLVDELTIIVAPVILGGGKRLFEGFSARSTSSTSASGSRSSRRSSSTGSRGGDAARL